jgi:hypothetical protein
MLSRNGGIFEREAEIIGEAVERLMAFQTDKAVRMKLNEVCRMILGQDANGQPTAPEIQPLSLNSS